MGACVGSNKKEDRASRELKQQTRPKRESKLAISVQSQYINSMLEKIISNQVLTLLLHKSIFEDLMNNFFNNYWSCDEKAALIRLLENYIKYSLSIVCDQVKNDTKYKEEISFGEVFGLEMHKLENEVNMKSHWMLEILDFSEEFFQNSFCLQDTTQLLKVTNDIKVQCEKDMLSMFYLSSYLVKACEKMEKQGKSISQICELLNIQATVLKGHYGAGAMKKKQQALMTRVDESEQAEKIKKFTLPQFKPIIFTLDPSEDKELQLQNQIIEMVQYAKQSLPFFNSLLYKACTESEGFGFKSNLKLNSRQNKSSLHRVKQKMLKKLIEKKAKPKEENQAIKNCKTIKQHLDAQTQYVKSLMKQIYQEIDNIQFNVSDLLRGKCLFNKVAHINNAANKIIENIKREKQAGKDVQLVQIDNRLNGRTKDLVLKVKIGDLVCQFQLALFFKQAENEIDHKMYELCRSKILSQLYLLYEWNKKSVDDYFPLIKNVIQYVNIDRSPSAHQKFENLKKFLNLEDVSFKKKQQYAHIDSNGAQVLENIKKMNFDKKKIQDLTEGRRLRSLQYLVEQNRQERAIQLAEEESTKSKDGYIQACELNILGTAYKNLKKNKQALESYQKSLNIKQKTKGSQSLDYAQTLNNIGLIYVSSEKYKDALTYYQRSLAIKKQVKGEKSIEYAQTLNNIGLVYDIQKNYDQALDYYNRSLLIKIIDKGSDSIDCAQTLNNIGLVYIRKKKYAEAVDYLSRSLAIKQKIKGKNSMDCAQTLNNMGAVYRKMGSYQDALDYYERSLAIKNKVKGCNSIDCAQTINNIGLVYSHQSNFSKAIECYNKALELKEKIYGKQSAQCISIQKEIKAVNIKIEKLKPDLTKSTRYDDGLKIESDYQTKENKENNLGCNKGGKKQQKNVNKQHDKAQDIILEGLELSVNK